jgi:hypothetical protein
VPTDAAKLAALGFERGYVGAARNTTDAYTAGLYVLNSAAHAKEYAAWSVSPVERQTRSLGRSRTSQYQE